ncbi:MAG: beta-Ala-His dipeptidase [Lachnospiraceae bacterium]|nr:beta-Ala-His dipeptidase [Lachnospiraceae bacterium]
MAASFEKVMQFFREICAIPHGSYNIDKISDYLVDFAKLRGIAYTQDELKNVILFKSATPGYEEEAPVMLQGHMDMVAVCDNPGEKDMTKEGLTLLEEEGFLSAEGTTLGADDGIAIAYVLAILDSEDTPHPAIEAVFTVNEEVGMEGASGIDLSECKSRRIINIDSEEEGEIVVSCAGGVRLHATFTGETQKITAPCVFLSLDGLLGGHSGSDIHENRANGAHLLAEILINIADEYDIHLISMAAGEKDNAIPSSGSAEFLVTNIGDPDDFMGYVDEIENILKDDYLGIENNITITAGIQLPQENICYTAEDTKRFLEYLFEAPDGVIAFCDHVDMVETSLNLGILLLTPESMNLDFALRSSVSEEKEKLLDMLTQITREFGGDCSASGDYPGWTYAENSPLRDRAVSIYREMFGKEPLVKGIHAGLECGVLLDKIPGAEAISIGPDILDAHTTKERLDLESAKRFYDYLLALLSKKGM